MFDAGVLLAETPADVAALSAPHAELKIAKNRRGERRRLGTRQARKLLGRRRDRTAFLDLLARHGDPALAAERLGLPLMLLYRHRDADPLFAAEWQAALGYAWEQVETRVLATLLAQLGDGAAARPVDPRLALAIMNGRDRPQTRSGARPVDSEAVARMRAEVRALAARGR